MLQPNNETNDLDDWEREDEEKYEENTKFPVKKQSIEEQTSDVGEEDKLSSISEDDVEFCNKFEDVEKDFSSLFLVKDK